MSKHHHTVEHAIDVAAVEPGATGRELDVGESTVGIATGNTLAGNHSNLYLGIDPGLNRTGYAILRRSASHPLLVEGGIVRSTKGETLATRVHEIGSGIREILAEFRPDAVALEEVFSMHKNPRTAVLMAHARGSILFAIAEAKLPLISYAPRQIKRLLTGSGTASKSQVQQAVQRELRLTAVLEPNDVADAAAIALCHYYSLRINGHENASLTCAQQLAKQLQTVRRA